MLECVSFYVLVCTRACVRACVCIYLSVNVVIRCVCFSMCLCAYLIELFVLVRVSTSGLATISSRGFAYAW